MQRSTIHNLDAKNAAKKRRLADLKYSALSIADAIDKDPECYY
jgi:hypothetical protein